MANGIKAKFALLVHACVDFFDNVFEIIAARCPFFPDGLADINSIAADFSHCVGKLFRQRIGIFQFAREAP